MLAMGNVVEEFEKNFAEYIGVKYAVATSSGTAALHIAIMALGIGKNDEVITTPFTFSATADAISFTGAKPVFVDIDSDTYNLDPHLIEKVITSKTKAILPVHLYGLPADMQAIIKIAKKHNLYTIEDAAQSHGAEYKKKKTGSLGTMGCFSFYATKNMTTAEGGMITTNNAKLAEKARMLRNHGSKVKYYHEILGYNYAMTNIEAAMGIEQLKKLDRFNLKRIKNATYFNNVFKKINQITIPKVSPNFKHVFHQYTIRVADREKLIEKLKDKNIGFGTFYPTPLHLQPHNKHYGYKKGDFPIAEKAATEVISLPVHPSLSRSNLDLITATVRSLYE